MTNTTSNPEKEESGHVSVLMNEVIEGLRIQEGSWIVDTTFGRGGHTRKILENGGSVIALDHDEEAVIFAARNFTKEIEQNKLIVRHENFDHLEEVVNGLDEQIRVNLLGILADFGVSSNQLDELGRGFSFLHDEDLDMRMDKRLSVRAKDLVNGMGRNELISLLEIFAQEHNAKRIAEAIVKQRQIKLIETTGELANLVQKVVGHRGSIHPATKTFMALRMLVNDEIGSIERMLPQAMRVMVPKARLVTISFQESEDRVVKRFMKNLEEHQEGIMISKKPITPSGFEIKTNPRSRSAKLRVFEKGTV